MLNRIKQSVNKRITSAGVSAALALASADVFAGPTLGTGGGGSFTLARQWMQNFVDFISGPFGTAAVVISIILVFLAWAYMPKDGIMGPMVRVATGGIVVINVATWLASFSGS